MITFTIPQDPIPLKRHRVGRNGRMYDPSHKDKKQTWLQVAKYRPKTPLKGEIMLKATFVMKRPKSHFRTGKYKHLLKKGVPEFHSGRPDLDNLLKFICDTIQGKERMICDDSHISVIFAEKVYGFNPRTEISIETI